MSNVCVYYQWPHGQEELFAASTSFMMQLQCRAERLAMPGWSRFPVCLRRRAVCIFARTAVLPLVSAGHNNTKADLKRNICDERAALPHCHGYRAYTNLVYLPLAVAPDSQPRRVTGKDQTYALFVRMLLLACTGGGTSSGLPWCRLATGQ